MVRLYNYLFDDSDGRILRFRTRDGGHMEARSADELVSLLRVSSYTRSRDLAHFMRQVSLRAFRFKGASVRHDDPTHFVEDLVSSKLLIPAPYKSGKD